MKTFLSAVLCGLVFITFGCRTEQTDLPSGRPAVNPVTTSTAKKTKEPPSNYSFSGGDGSTLEKAVIVNGPISDLAAVKAEHFWLQKHYPGYQETLQSLLNSNGHIYDRQDIQTGDGPKTVFFDITSSFGKF